MGRFLALLAVLIVLNCPAFAEEPDLGLSETPPIPDGGYIIGPGDLLQIKVFNVETLTGEYPVRYDGTVMFPYVGNIEAAGVPLGEFNENLTEKLATYYYDPQVVVNISEFSSCEVYVLGEVVKPGIYTFDGRATILEVVAQAGGFDRTAARASTMLVRVIGDTPMVTRIDMEKVVDEGAVTLNVPVQRGDIIVVPKTFIANLNQFLSDISPSLATYLRVNSVYRAQWEK